MSMLLPSGFKVKGLSTGEIRKKAESARSTLLSIMKVNCVQQINPSQLIEHLDEIGIEVQIIDDSDSEISLSAPAGMVRDVLKIRDSIYEGFCQQNSRDWFTVAHELGHYFLKHERSLNRGQIEKHEWYEDSEWQANSFASELLMPLEDVQTLRPTSWLDIYQEFNVSMQAAEVRFSKLKKQRLI